MNELFLVAAHNTVVALGLAFVVWGVTRVWRNPAVAHLLWLVVLLKLVAPPVMHVDWSSLLPAAFMGSNRLANPGLSRNVSATTGADSRHLRAGAATAERVTPDDRPEVEQSAEQLPLGPPLLSDSLGFADHLRSLWDQAKLFVLWVWLSGAAVCALVATRRVVRFETILRGTLPASEQLQRLGREIADKFHVLQMPDVRSVEWIDVPLLWCAGRRPTIVLPVRLIGQLNEEQSAMILAHEMAHLRRRDHWVRAVELIVSTVYWWNPLVWLICRQIHVAEEFCCDAWVRVAFSNRERAYAELVLKTAELANPTRLPAGVLPASPFLRSLSLKARVEMILKSRFTPSVSAKSLTAVLSAALLVLPSVVQTIKAEATDDSSAAKANYIRRSIGLSSTAPAAQTRPHESEFPYAVRFEPGETQFLDGDKITILEVRGTAETFLPGNLYWIKGTYTLGSHDQAMLAAYTTAKEAKDAIGPSYKFQTTTVQKGTGTFTLFYPMSCDGWPHVSFYPAGGGNSFGGNYFGTGETVLKPRREAKSETSQSQKSDLSIFQQIAKLGGRLEQRSLEPSESRELAKALANPFGELYYPNEQVTAIDFTGSRMIRDQDLLLLKSFTSLQTFGLGHTGITDAGLENLAQIERMKARSAAARGLEFPGLWTLYIDNTAITDTGLKALKDFPKLSTLGLGHTRITDAGLETVRRLGNLTHLYIDNTGITDAGLARLSDLANLNTLGLGHTAITDAGLKTVSNFKKLTHLYIDNTKITDAGLGSLKDLSDLNTLGLGHTSVTDGGLENLKGLKNLATLYVDQTEVTGAAVERLQESLPHLKVIRWRRGQ